MDNIRDFRPDAVKMAALANAKAKVAGRKLVVELHTDEFVHLHCGGRLFIVYRDVVVAGSMYFECAFFGFFKETYNQEVFFDDEIDADTLDFYLNIAHSWYFEIKVLGAKVVPASAFEVPVRALQEEPLEKQKLEIPKLKLAKMAQTVILADRFIHRSLLSIMRQMFLSLLEFTHAAWVILKFESRDWGTYYHEEIMFDYMHAYNLLSMGHDDEDYLRDALTESFYWFSLYCPSLREHYWIFMPHEFIDEWNVDRSDHEPTRMLYHAMGLFRTDQMIYASTTRKQKDRRYKRVMNTCSPEYRKEFLPWFETPEQKKARIDRLRTVVLALQDSFHVFVPGASYHGTPAQTSGAMVQTGGHHQNQTGNHPRGRGKGRKLRGAHSSRGGHHHTQGDQQSQGAPGWTQASQWNSASNSEQLSTPSNNNMINQTNHDQAEHAAPESGRGRKKNRKNKNKNKKTQTTSADQSSDFPQAGPSNVSMSQAFQPDAQFAMNGIGYDCSFPSFGQNPTYAYWTNGYGQDGADNQGAGNVATGFGYHTNLPPLGNNPMGAQLTIDHGQNNDGAQDGGAAAEAAAYETHWPTLPEAQANTANNTGQAGGSGGRSRRGRGRGRGRGMRRGEA